LLLLGWPSLTLGLRRWYEQGRPGLDQRFQLLNDVWADDLDALTAWACSSCSARDLERAISERVAAPSGPSRVEVDQAWLQGLASRIEDSSPFGIGDDPLHLASHIEIAIDSEPHPAVLLEPDNRTAVLILDEYTGWYRAVAKAGENLPTLANGRSWRVTVVCRPIGVMGVYRRSRQTHRWFSGRHRFHELGIA
jgi:hypothetical protein